MRHQKEIKDTTIGQIILNQYLKEFPEDINKDLSPIEIKQKKDRIVLFTRSWDGWRIITFKNAHNGTVKFNKSEFCSSYEHALGECLNYFEGTI